MLLIIPSAANQQTQTSNLSVRGTKPIIPSNGPRDQMQLMIQVIFLLLWINQHTNLFTDILGPEGQLQDVECGAPALVFTDAGKPTQGGRDIYCINGGLTEESGTTQSQTEAPTPAPGRLRLATAGIPAENDCLMTCDDYSVLQFYTDYNRDGEVGRGWFFEIVGFQMDPVRMDNADILDCWG